MAPPYQIRRCNTSFAWIGTFRQVYAESEIVCTGFMLIPEYGAGYE